ncbi:DNA repair protein RecO [Spirochaetes bacterium]|uniref:DNA repair protein RecO n=1 Tax=Candidatus Scatousia excrementipullorum TaxID=2840936 RepID=A0A9D9DUE0_9BACT|nr:DNA repair protein RecO [Candidatus Scatousia excrementipullorum]
METFVTDAINLKSYNLSESDKIMVMYSRDKGLIRGVAKGVKKPKSKLGARMDLLVANKLMLHKGKNLDTISQAEALNTFNATRRNMDKIFYSMYVSEVVNNFGVEDDPCSAVIFDLLYEALNTISIAEDKIQILNAVLKFQLKMMRISGFSLELEKCLCCGKPVENKNMYFSSRLGGIVCLECNSHYGLTDIMHYKLRDFLSALANTEFDDESEYEKKATEKICLVSFELLKSYINAHCTKKFHSTEILQEVV